METFIISEYVANIQAGNRPPRIYFRNSDNTKRGEMLFMDGTLTDCVRGGPGYYTILMEKSYYPYVIDLLRNEAPAVLTVDADTDYGMFRTSYEPVGEEES